MLDAFPDEVGPQRGVRVDGQLPGACQGGPVHAAGELQSDLGDVRIGAPFPEVMEEHPLLHGREGQPVLHGGMPGWARRRKGGQRLAEAGGQLLDRRRLELRPRVGPSDPQPPSHHAGVDLQGVGAARLRRALHRGRFQQALEE